MMKDTLIHLPSWVLLTFMFALAYVQNMAFTWSSRTRNQNDPKLHRYAAWCSNSIWFIMQVTIGSSVFNALTTGNPWLLIASFFVYTIATTEGSVKMMEILIKKGK
jgi:hypothetical protein